MSIRRIVLLGVCVFAVTSFSETLTKSKLLELQQAGVGSQALITLIRNDGVGFPVDADATLELKRAGIGDDVLQVLLEQKATTPKTTAPVPAPSGPYGPAQQAYASGDFTKAAESLREVLKSSPNDARAQALLAMACMKGRDVACGESAYTDLQKNTSPAAAPLRERVGSILDDLHEQDRVRQTLQAALHSFDREACLKVIQESKLAPTQKTTLEAWIEVYSGEYSKAREKVQSLPSELSTGLAAAFADYEKRASSAKCSLSWRFSDPICPAPPNLQAETKEDAPDNAASQQPGLGLESLTMIGRRMNARGVARIESDLANLIEAAPLDRAGAGYLFMTAFLVKPYPEAKTFNDALLKSFGTVTVSFLARNVAGTGGIAYMVQRFSIDSRAGKLLISPGANFGTAVRAIPAYSTLLGGRDIRDITVPSRSFPFDQFKSLSQHFKYADSHGKRVAPDSLFLLYLEDMESSWLTLGGDFTLAGSPMPLTMVEFIGFPETKRVIHDFGQYVWSLNPVAKASPQLIDVTAPKVKKEGSGLFTALMFATAAGLSTASGSSTGRLETVNQSLQSFATAFSAAAPAVLNTGQSGGGAQVQPWDRIAVEKAFQPVLNQSFSALETLWSAGPAQ